MELFAAKVLHKELASLAQKTAGKDLTYDNDRVCRTASKPTLIGSRSSEMV